MKTSGVLVLIVLGLSLIFGGLSFTKGQLEKAVPQQQSSKEIPATSPTSAKMQTNVLGKGEEQAVAVKVIDGDTIQLANGSTVRYIGIDTPETSDPSKPVQCFSKEASDMNRQLVEGKTVRLVKDISQTDKYGRLLRYVFINTLFVNDYLVRQGYAYASSYPPDVRYQDQFNDAQKEARENNRGLWNVCGDDTEPLDSAEGQPSVKGTSTADMDCSDFASQEQAQAFFISQGGPQQDPHRLDSDKDGVVCESLP